ncbi:Galactose oxidase/kelch, beta-propeller [Metarhizium rileyi]|uniref:Galactose oxidase/kelch, beta-propeller n=1 Tax=Metarhizium rileyi (strain RCEF 4871) TaxID=1649241 RepID=A0A167HVU5_METRR|nr:Galactose oxidase/kelch, beta-propeller [Metarhizium rileyi RCEF 4871]
MKFSSTAKSAICIGLSVLSNAQFSNWQSNQVNTSICLWIQPRAALIRDTIYLDGGSIWWSPGLASGEIGNLQGYVLSYNLSESFQKGSNVTGNLVKNLMSKALGGSQSGISSEPTYYDGGMLANDAQFFLYGGTLFENTALYDSPAANAVLSYRRYAYGPEKPLWSKGFLSGHLDDGVTRYVAYGGAVSAPSENKAWYFSGLTSPTRGPIVTYGNVSRRATDVSNTLIELDMTDQHPEKWANITLPDNIIPRANPEVVWVPVGKQGILVVLGGVVYPEWVSPSHKSPNETESKLKSPEFMRTIDIYDIANKEWYQQPTEGGPGASARGCAVVAAAPDNSSFNIYYYGGYDGIHLSNDFSDEVWVLSLPSFTWTLLNKGTPAHGRSGHKCFKIYPDQMMVLGGYPPTRGTSLTCLDQGPVVVFNLTSGNWLDGYSPTKYGDYGVHEKITALVGGTASGGATVSSPRPSGWASKRLGDVFSVAYDTKKLKQYWPYYPLSSPAPSATTTPSESSDKSSLATIIPAVLVPVICSVGIGIALWFYCLRRKKSAAASSSDSTANESGLNIMTWVRGQGAIKRSMMTESPHKFETGTSPDLDGISAFEPPSTEKSENTHHEMEDTQVLELCDTSSPAELHDTGFTPMGTFQKQFGSFGPELSSSQYNRQSEFGRLSAAFPTSGGERHWIEPPLPDTWARSPSVLETPDPSDPCDFSKSQALPMVSPEEHAQHDLPVSPASSSGRFGGDYITAGATMSPINRPMSGETEDGRFHEHF